ncbi:MAG: TlyA family RNA methyltransferase [Candidatus Dormibacteraeota bacterium]|nr:TlyA family RNA methyltransferase [Candidatus Dormibacteraeota bacterium]
MSKGGSRLDLALVAAGLAESRSQAQALILAGKVRVAGATERRASRQVRPGEAVELVARPPFVSRGGEKLAPALDAFGIEVAGRVCADIGASTGGFTDVLLQRGAAHVFAVDVGRGLIHWRLRQDPRVELMERVNARELRAFSRPVSLITVDVSFIGLEKVLPALQAAAPGAEYVVLFKPQFQVGRTAVGKGGVVRDPDVVRVALDAFSAWCQGAGLEVRGEAPAAVRGAEGNQEHLLHLQDIVRPPSAPAE